ncbi:MAG TPA: hypothetical protein VHO50_07960 [Bacteroidales bacterium]|nr:hypothetical protein [Bacteroidales bacterium]
MKNRNCHFRHNEHHPRIGFGLFLIALGLALLVATNDLLHLGGVSEYFNWKTAMIFIGVLLFLNLEFVGGVFLIAGGVWFMRDEIFPFASEQFKSFFWPSIIALGGVAFILTALFKKRCIR